MKVTGIGDKLKILPISVSFTLSTYLRNTDATCIIYVYLGTYIDTLKYGHTGPEYAMQLRVQCIETKRNVQS